MVIKLVRSRQFHAKFSTLSGSARLRENKQRSLAPGSRGKKPALKYLARLFVPNEPGTARKGLWPLLGSSFSVSTARFPLEDRLVWQLAGPRATSVIIR